MKTEIKPARKRAPYGFAKWEAPAKFLRQSPPEHRGIPFADDKDYIRTDTFDEEGDECDLADIERQKRIDREDWEAETLRQRREDTE